MSVTLNLLAGEPHSWTIREWDYWLGEYELQSARMNVVLLHFSSVDGKVRRYDIRFGKLFCDTVGRKAPPLPPHPPPQSPCSQKRWFCHLSSSEPVTSASFSRDGHCILTSSLDDRLRLLDKDNGELLNEWVRIDFFLPSIWVLSGQWRICVYSCIYYWPIGLEFWKGTLRWLSQQGSCDVMHSSMTAYWR